MGATDEGEEEEEEEEEEAAAVVAPAALVVRAWRDAAGRLTGVVERVTTGERVRFQGADVMAQIVERMVPKPKASGPLGRGEDRC
jgi:hypothetical protein